MLNYINGIFSLEPCTMYFMM